MSGAELIKRFGDKTIRTHWDEATEEWYFAIVDVVEVLTDSVNPRDYIKKMRKRDSELNAKWGTICPPIDMTGKDGRKRKIQAATAEGVLRIIQSIPSPKAEPFKQWLAKVGAERIEETIDPELSIDRALETYLRKGYDRNWINQRLLSIRVRKELADEWQNRGVQKGEEFAILTDELTRAWSGMTTRQYKNHKGLTKENLRDNMTTTEIVLNMLAEVSTTNISKAEQPETFEQNRRVAKRGGNIAGTARQQIEQQTGKSVISSQNANDIRNAVVGGIEVSAKLGGGSSGVDSLDDEADNEEADNE